MAYGFISHSGLATGILDYTNEFLLIGVGFFSLLVLSSGMIVWTAIQCLRSETDRPAIPTASPSEKYDWAA